MHATQGGETEKNHPQCNQTKTISSPSESQVNKYGNDDKSESSISNTGSSDENIVDPCSHLELRDNMATTASKVDSIDKSVAQLDSKLDEKVSILDSKLDVILQSLSEIKKIGPPKLSELINLISSCHYNSITLWKNSNKSITTAWITTSQPPPS